MSDNFLKFKRRLLVIRVERSLLIGSALGFAACGIMRTLSLLALVPFEPWLGIAVGAGVLLLGGLTVFLLLRRSDKEIAEALDEKFGLNERVQTMIAYRNESGTLVDMQRADADEALGGVRDKRIGIKRLWIYVLALALSSALLVTSFFVPDKRDFEEPEVITPFTLTAAQEAGILELIGYVEKSDMQSPFKEETTDVLNNLLERLKVVSTEPDMRVALAEAMAYLLDITDRSSSAVEILNALWSDGNVYLKYLARVLESSEWQSSDDWGEFAERLLEYKAALYGEISEDEASMMTKLLWAVDVSSRNTVIALSSSGISADDILYLAITDLATGEGGYSELTNSISELDYASATELTSAALDAKSNMLFDAVKTLKINTDTGEYVMTRLSALFLVPLPEFERPDFVKNRETINGETSEEEKDDEDGESDGGIGEGATFGSDDLVLDPLTGNYVEYGTLIHQYDALMYEKLESGSYTEEQKQAIKNYFALLYSGIKKEEGN